MIIEAKLSDLQHQADEKAKQYIFGNLPDAAIEVVNKHLEIQKILEEDGK